MTLSTCMWECRVKSHWELPSIKPCCWNGFGWLTLWGQQYQQKGIKHCGIKYFLLCHIFVLLLCIASHVAITTFNTQITFFLILSSPGSVHSGSCGPFKGGDDHKALDCVVWNCKSYNSYKQVTSLWCIDQPSFSDLETCSCMDIL